MNSELLHKNIPNQTEIIYCELKCLTLINIRFVESL